MLNLQSLPAWTKHFRRSHYCIKSYVLLRLASSNEHMPAVSPPISMCLTISPIFNDQGLIYSIRRQDEQIPDLPRRILSALSWQDKIGSSYTIDSKHQRKMQ